MIGKEATNVLVEVSANASQYGTSISSALSNAWSNADSRINDLGQSITNFASNTWQSVANFRNSKVTIEQNTKIIKDNECFVAGTEIITRDGTKNIEDIQVGDWVLSDDPNTPGEIEYKQVLKTFVKTATSTIDIYIDGEKITTTENHPFWVPEVGWVAAKDLNAGTYLQTKTESWLDIDGVDRHTGATTVYNFEVAGFHTYFVSDLGFLVHNTCGVEFRKALETRGDKLEALGLQEDFQTLLQAAENGQVQGQRKNLSDIVDRIHKKITVDPLSLLGDKLEYQELSRIVKQGETVEIGKTFADIVSHSMKIAIQAKYVSGDGMGSQLKEAAKQLAGNKAAINGEMPPADYTKVILIELGKGTGPARCEARS